MRKIIIENVPSQRFEVVIPEESKSIVFNINYIARGDYFVLGLSDSEQTFVNSIKIVSGVLLLSAFNFLSGDFVVANSSDYPNDPKMGTWQSQTEFFYLTKEEVEALNV